MYSLQRLSCLLLALISVSCTRQPSIQAKQDTGPLAIRVSPVVIRHVRRFVESVGTLFPFDESIISAEIDGRVDEVKVDLGDRVTEGQVMVHISDEEQRYLLAQNEAQLRQALERLGLKDDKDRLKDPSEAPDPRRAKADLLDAEQQYKRSRILVEQGIGTRAALDQAEAHFKAMEATYDATLNQTRNLIQQVEQSKAVLGLQRKKLRDTSVRAPVTAYVKERQVTVGQYVKVNTPLMTLVKIDPIRFRMEVPERMAPWVKVGQIADVTMEAFGDQKFEGKIWRISPTVDQSKRTFVVEALISNPGGRLKPGSYARARVPTDKVEDIKLVPVRAVNYVFGSNKAYVVIGDGIEARDVKVGDRIEQQVEILEGVQEGEKVATSQLARLDTGIKVRIVGTD